MQQENIVQKKKLDTFNYFCSKFDINGIQNSPLFQEAMTHSSVSKKQNYERMEFLGDTLLNFCISRMLFEYMPDVKEGLLSKNKSFLCSRKVCRLVAKEINLDTQVLVSKRQQMDIDFILADILESFLCAVYYEFGIEKVHEIVENLFKKYINSNQVLDPKMALQEITQKKYKKLPEYTLISKEGTDDNPIFTVSVSYGKYCSYGSGKNKKSAEKQAAEKMLLLLDNNK